MAGPENLMTSLFWSFFPFVRNSRPGGGGCKSKFSKPQMSFFPFVRNSRPGGGGWCRSFCQKISIFNNVCCCWMSTLQSCSAAQAAHALVNTGLGASTVPYQGRTLAVGELGRKIFGAEIFFKCNQYLAYVFKYLLSIIILGLFATPHSSLFVQY